MKFVTTDDVSEWYAQAADLAEFTRGIGVVRREADEHERPVNLPIHLQFAIGQLAKERWGPVPPEALDSISFYSLCKGLFLPLAGLTPQRVASLFGFQWQPAGTDQAVLVRTFFDRPLGLTFVQKVACVLGDPFLGRKGTMRRDTLLRLYHTIHLAPRGRVLDRLTVVGDVAVLFAESTANVRVAPPLTAQEVLTTLRLLPGRSMGRKLDVLRSLIDRCGRMERYFLARLVLRRAGFGWDYQGPLLAKLVAEKFGVAADSVELAMVLTDPLHVAKVLEESGPAALRGIQLQPLAPVRPALASGGVERIEQFPVWVERKYDGIRLLLHKATDARGSVACAAYTRNRSDWLELVPGLQNTIAMLPATTAIVDGELYGTSVDPAGIRPASVYEVYTMLQGSAVRPVQLRFAAFDLLYLNGRDVTGQTLGTRRQLLASLLTPLLALPTAVPFTLTEGQLAQNAADVNRLFQHFRAQGYEGIIAKDWEGPYRLGVRDPAWVKRKPEVTLDLVLLGGVFAVTTKETAGALGSYVLGARNDAGGFEIVGDVAGLDVVRDREIQAEVMRLGLLTGRRIERPSSSGVRPGLEFRPALVVTVKFEGIIRDSKSGKYSLRDPKIAHVRSDKSAYEADDLQTFEKLYLNQRLS